MRFPIYFVCATLVLAVRATNEDTNTEAGFYAPRRIQTQDEGQKDETFNYLLPRLTPKYRPSSRWNDNIEFDYVMNELDGNNVNEQDPELGSEERFKRAGPSLSIVNPLDVLRQRLLLEMARRQMRENSRQVSENRKLMKAIGKRGNFLRQPDSHLRGNSIGYDTM